MKKGITLLLILTLCLTACGNSAKAPEQANAYTVIVVGSEPEGISAAVSAARSGAKTLLVTRDAELGGLMTLGELNFIDMCEGRDGTRLTQGIFNEFYDAVGGTAFDIEKAKQVFQSMLDGEKKLDWQTGYDEIHPIMNNANAIIGVNCVKDGRITEYIAETVIDATADADLAAEAGVPYTFAGEDIGEKDRQMGVTLVFELAGVNWSEITDYLEHDDNAGTGATDKAAWGYTKEGFAYVPQDSLMRLRGFNIARLDNGNVLLNALIIFGVDVLDEDSKAEGIARGQKELSYIVPYLRENCRGFAEAALVKTAQRLYVRESRHIIGEYQLTIDDVLENRDRADKIAIGGYPVDVQPTATQTYGTVIGSPDRYAISYGCIVPLEVDHLLVVGRCASYQSLAAGSARVIPIGMAEGQAAGIAAHYAAEHQMNVREIYYDAKAVAAIQRELKKNGAYLDDFSLPEPITEHWAYDGVKTLRALGLLDGGYANDYGLDKPLGKWKFQNTLNRALDKAGFAHEYIEISEQATAGETVAAAAALLGSDADSYSSQLDYLQSVGVLSESEAAHFPAMAEQTPTVAEAVVLIAGVYHALR